MTFFGKEERRNKAMRWFVYTDIKTTRDNYDKSSTKTAHIALEQLHGIYTKTPEERIEEYESQIAELEKAANKIKKELKAI